MWTLFINQLNNKIIVYNSLCTFSESNESTHDKVEIRNCVCNVHCFKNHDPMCMTINYKREFDFQPYQ